MKLLILGRGLLTPEQLITGPLFDRLLVELAAVNIRFEITETAGGHQPEPYS
jgi:hypothetical protein